MRYIFLLFIAIGWQLSVPSLIYAQQDTLRLEIKNIPALYCLDSQKYSPRIHYCDSTSISEKFTFIFNSIRINGDTVAFSRDSNYDNPNEWDIFKLTIIYDTIGGKVNKIILTHNSGLYGTSLQSDGWHDVLFFSLELVRFQRKGRMLSAFYTGSDLLEHNFHYTHYSESYSFHGTNYSVSDTTTSTGAVTDSSSISINLSTIALLDVPSSNVVYQELRINPNPSSNVITVSNSNSVNVYIFDLFGRTLPFTKLDDHEQLDISSLPPGIYYLRAGNQMQKFVIQR